MNDVVTPSPVKQFAKLFNDTPHGQILVKLCTSHNEDGPEVRFFFHPPGLGECSVAFACDDTDAGWRVAEKAFAKVDEEMAIDVVGSGSGSGSLIDDLKASIGLDPDSTAFDSSDAKDQRIAELERQNAHLQKKVEATAVDYHEIHEQHDQLKSLYFQRGQQIEQLTAHIERIKAAWEENADSSVCANLTDAMEPVLDSSPSSTSLAHRDAETIASLAFPTMLRKMWSGGEVQQWLNEQALEKRRQAEGK
ncbi:hypothetical protein ACT3R7_11805 [Halomonas sp. AOP43-A1-21]